jgi:hypothetical protein
MHMEDWLQNHTFKERRDIWKKGNVFMDVE